MKKTLFCTLITLCSLTFSLADTSDIFKGLRQEIQRLDNQNLEVYLERLRMFGLIESNNKKELLEKVGDSSIPIDLIRELQIELNGSYLGQAQKYLGKCTDGHCLESDGKGQIFIDAQAQRHCYPNTDCEYYKCMEEKYSCMSVGVEYFEKLAYPTCSSYIENIKSGRFSVKGKEWIYNVMVCLQKGLFEECSLKGNCVESENNSKTCEHIVDFTLKFHPGCYLESGVGVCRLPLPDQINIWRTVAPYLTKRETLEAFKVVYQCLFR